MAEVFLAKSVGLQGFEKVLAIKRILPSVSEDSDFTTMFIDEAKISANLTHTNIGQVFEFGEVRGQYYIAMEYIPGKDLRAIQTHLGETGRVMPPVMALHVLARLCHALDYAHRQRNPEGVSMDIVHRDVSPPNVIVSFDGVVKLIDFGIAKAASRATRTRAGKLKGKFAYMSPEQVQGLPVDRRSDVFSLGIVLHELLTGRRLFQGDNQLATLNLVRWAEAPPPSSINPDVPLEVDRIVLQALARDRDQRYAWAAEFRADIERYLAVVGTVYEPHHLGVWMQAEFAGEIEAERRMQERVHSLDPAALGGEDSQADGSLADGGSSSAASEWSTGQMTKYERPLAGARVEQERDLGLQVASALPRPSLTAQERRRDPRAVTPAEGPARAAASQEAEAAPAPAPETGVDSSAVRDYEPYSLPAGALRSTTTRLDPDGNDVAEAPLDPVVEKTDAVETPDVFETRSLRGAQVADRTAENDALATLAGAGLDGGHRPTEHTATVPSPRVFGPWERKDRAPMAHVATLLNPEDEDLLLPEEDAFPPGSAEVSLPAPFRLDRAFPEARGAGRGPISPGERRDASTIGGALEVDSRPRRLEPRVDPVEHVDVTELDLGMETTDRTRGPVAKAGQPGAGETLRTAKSSRRLQTMILAGISTLILAGTVALVLFIWTRGDESAESGSVVVSTTPAAACSVSVGFGPPRGLLRPGSSFRLSNVPSGRHLVTVECLGFRAYTAAVEVKPGQASIVVAPLERN
jgi:hypothetical protein